jgi:hypothetical protein
MNILEAIKLLRSEIVEIREVSDTLKADLTILLNETVTVPAITSPKTTRTAALETSATSVSDLTTSLGAYVKCLASDLKKVQESCVS